MLPAAVQGTLKGYDQLLNLVMDETIEYLRGEQTGNCSQVLSEPDSAMYCKPFLLL